MQKTPYSFQARCMKWILAWLNTNLIWNKQEWNQKFLEESLELVQSLDMDKETAHKLVDYVFGRPKGEPKQELGGVMNTLAILAETNNMSMWADGEDELVRCWNNIDKIREKQKVKPKLTGTHPTLIIIDEVGQITYTDFDPLGR